MKLPRWVLLLCVLFGSLQAEELKGPSEADFINEIFDAAPTDKTADFRDRPDGYSIEKAKLQKALLAFAEKQGLNLRAFLICGPTGEGWAYQVSVFWEEGKQIRMNTVYFPHARITHKSTGRISVDQFEKFQEAVSMLPPSEKRSGIGDAAERLWFGWRTMDQKDWMLARNSLTNDKPARIFEKAYNTLLAELIQTYPKPPEPEGK